MPVTSCPRCSTDLVDVQIEGHTVGSCPAGHGAWFEQPALDRIVEDDTDEFDAGDEAAAWSRSEDHPGGLETERYRTCPICSQTLRKDVFKYGSGVVVDVCDEHGTWVDGGEIARIEAWSEAWASRQPR